MLKLDVPPLRLRNGQTYAHRALKLLAEDPRLDERHQRQLAQTKTVRYQVGFYERMLAGDNERVLLSWCLNDAEINAVRSLLPYPVMEMNNEAFLRVLRQTDPKALDASPESLRHAIEGRETFVLFQATIEQIRLDIPGWLAEKRHLDELLQPAWRRTWEALVDLALYDIETLVYGNDQTRLEDLMVSASFKALEIYYGLRLPPDVFRVRLQRWAAALLTERDLLERRVDALMAKAKQAY